MIIHSQWPLTINHLATHQPSWPLLAPVLLHSIPIRPPAQAFHLPTPAVPRRLVASFQQVQRQPEGWAVTAWKSMGKPWVFTTTGRVLGSIFTSTHPYKSRNNARSTIELAIRGFARHWNRILGRWWCLGQLLQHQLYPGIPPTNCG